VVSASARTHRGSLRARSALTATVVIAALFAFVAAASASSPRDSALAGAPTVSFSYAPATVQAGVPVTFTAAVTPGTDGAPIAQISWDLGSGNFGDAPGTSATTTFTSSGLESISVEVIDTDGMSSTSTQAIDVAPAAGSILSPAIVIRPELKLVSAKVSRDLIKLKLTCAFAVCQTTTSMATYEHRRAGKLTALTATAGESAGRARVGASDIRVPVGRTETYTLKLNGTGRRLLKRFDKLPLTISFSEIKATPHLTVKAKAKAKGKTNAKAKKPKAREH
jgi:PKD repeat protein